MAKINCAKCGNKIRLISPVNANWCKKDKMFYCRKCATTKLTCPSCRGRVSSSISMMLLMGIALFIIFSLIMIPFSLRGPNILEQAEWNSLESQKIVELIPNKTAKITGLIESDHPVPISRYREEQANGSTLKIKENHPFSLTDNSGAIPVNLSELSWFVDYHHEEYGDNWERYWFENGEQISCIGVAKFNESGNLTFYPEVIALSSDGYFFFISILIFGMFGSSAIFGLILFLIGYYTLRRRIRLHLENIESSMDHLQARKISPLIPLHDAQWIKNEFFYKMYFWGKISAGITIILFIAFLYSLMIGDFNLEMLFLIILVFPSAFALTFLIFNRSISPTHVGFDNNGIHTRYKSKNPHPSLFQYVEWGNIKNIDHSPIPGSNRLIFNTVDGRELIMGNISKELVNLVMEEYQTRREKKVTKKAVAEPTMIEDVQRTDYSTLNWEINDYRKKYLKRAMMLILLQLLLIPICILYVVAFGVNQSILFFTYPMIMAVIISFIQFWMPSKIAITKNGVYIDKKGKILEHKFKNIDKVLYGFRSIKLGYGEDLIETVDFITPNTASRIIKAIEEYKKKHKVTVHEFSGIPEIMWKKNGAYVFYRRIFFIPIIIVISSAIVLIILSYFSLLDWFYSTLIIMISSTFLILLIQVWYPMRQAPIRVGFSNEGLHCEYVKREIDKVLLKWISWKDISEMDLDSGPEDYIGGPILRTGKNRNYAQIQKNSGARYLLGPIDDDILGELRIRPRI